MTADPDRPCLHENFEVFADIGRMTATDDGPPVAFTAEIRVSCTDCGEPFRWTGLEAGLSQKKPMVSPDETELRAPLRPASADPDFGMGLPGFAVRYRGRNDG